MKAKIRVMLHNGKVREKIFSYENTDILSVDLKKITSGKMREVLIKVVSNSTKATKWKTI